MQEQSFRDNIKYKQTYKAESTCYEIKNMLDERSAVKDISEFPQNIVGYIKTSFYRKQDKKQQLIGSIHGTGTLIAPGVVLTCAHNLLPPTQEFGNSHENIQFFLAYHEYLGDKYKAKHVQYPRKELQQGDQQKEPFKRYDFALIFLEMSNNLMEKPQIDFVWSEKILKEYVAVPQRLLTYGYPSDLNIKKVKSLQKPVTNQNLIGYQYGCEGYLFQSKQESLLQYNMLARQGQSGSPIFLLDGSQLKLIGIHKGQYRLNRISYGITLWSMKQHIKMWLQRHNRHDLIWQLIGNDA